jgi:hypothetical protein
MPVRLPFRSIDLPTGSLLSLYWPNSSDPCRLARQVKQFSG